MNLSDCTIGTLVVEYVPTGPRIGHISGLTVNLEGQTIPIITFPGTMIKPFVTSADIVMPHHVQAIHHKNLEKFDFYQEKILNDMMTPKKKR